MRFSFCEYRAKSGSPAMVVYGGCGCTSRVCALLRQRGGKTREENGVRFGLPPFSLEHRENRKRTRGVETAGAANEPVESDQYLQYVRMGSVWCGVCWRRERTYAVRRPDSRSRRTEMKLVLYEKGFLQRGCRNHRESKHTQTTHTHTHAHTHTVYTASR